MSVISHLQFSLVSAGMAYNFNKIDTLNQGTSYDYGSVMQYEKYGRRHVCDLHTFLFFL